MTRLEDLTRGATLMGVMPGQSVTVVDIKWFGDSAVELTYKLEETGQVFNRLLYRSDEAQITIAQPGRSWAFDGDGHLFRLASEAFRIRLAFLFDPQLGVTVSQIEPLPHQIAAVYEEMLRRQPLRYLLADDPGAGKTIMAGLFIKELMLRGDLERCLIVVPASLAEQWQDELYDKFRLRFDIVGRSEIEQAVGNPFEERDLVISRLDLLKQEENLERLAQVEWDLIIVDEAHKMSATYFGNELKETERYRLGKLLSSRTRNLLLLTATPHRGKEEDFQLFLALLDADRFEGRYRPGVHQAEVSDVMRRLMKEDLVDFEGKPLFPERRAYTVTYPLSELEAKLYEEVTRYVTQEMARADQLAEEGTEGRRRQLNVGFALTVLQRRLASSPEAIYQSIRRRRQRLERRREELLRRRSVPGIEVTNDLDLRRWRLDEEDLEDLPEDEVEEIVDLASAARTVQELENEISHLKRLEALAKQVRFANTDSKWVELSRLLQDRAEMFDPNGRRRKLVIFSEHRDTLEYLVDKVRNLLGRPEAVVEIHGGMGRDLRRSQQNRFVNDSEVQILIATDAAGEGINLQRAHLMVNYDLPWNPNRLEQRFGRIHRFGQREVCHLWNLVAHGTREGAVFQRLLEKLEVERQALGGKVFDVLGSVFQDVSLRDLLLEAIRYGDDPAVRRRLETRLDEAMSHQHCQEVIERHALARSVLDTSRLQRLKEACQRAEVNRLVPHFIASFFIEAFRYLGGVIHEREPRRYEVRNVPAEVRRRAQQVGRRASVLRAYERICFEKERVNVAGKPPAEFVAPGHPLLDAVIDLILERYRDVLRRGAVLVDPHEGSERPRVLFSLQSSITDGRLNKSGERQVVSSRLHFVEIDDQGQARALGAAPYLDYRPVGEHELPAVERLLAQPWLQQDMEDSARTYAIQTLVQQHFEDVRREREDLVLRTMAAVKDRLTKEIIYWDLRAEELKAQELAGRQPRMNSARARERCEQLTQRLQNRMRELELERQLAAQPPIVIGGALVVPAAVLAALAEQPLHAAPKDVRRIEDLAMAAVLATERRAGRVATDVSYMNLGYDIESREPESGRLRFIEVKGRRADADTVVITRNEMLVALNKRQDYYLAVALVRDDAVQSLHYVQDPLARLLSGDVQFGMVAVVLKLNELLSVDTAEVVR